MVRGNLGLGFRFEVEDDNIPKISNGGDLYLIIKAELLRICIRPTPSVALKLLIY